MFRATVAETVYGRKLVLSPGSPTIAVASACVSNEYYDVRSTILLFEVSWMGFVLNSFLQAERQEDYGTEYLPPIHQSSHFCKSDPIALIWILDRYRYLDDLMAETQRLE